ncbi:MAG: type II toxin-antitoxin system RelB/DinJ family antitoxin [Candidatus Peribacteraceae bacterium]|jgi:DNA-damage-inducible protein J|nr:type II toxin-antitoxin system RelB/DinJ family antitoxin [Candidatus Peribacteraceae bacterium]
MTAIQVRTGNKLKRDVQKVLESIGLDMSSAIKLYLHQIVITQSIPFPLRTVNGYTVEQEQKMIREGEEALKNGKRYRSVDAMFRDILGK